MLDVTPFLAPERAALVDLLRHLGPTEWDAPTECPAWSVKGVALHVLGDDFSLLSRQRDAATNGLVLYAADHPGLGFRQLLDGFNDQWVRTAMFLSPRIVVDLLVLTGRWSTAYYRSVDLDEAGEPVGFFGATTPAPWWQVVAREYAERWIHHQQVRRALGRDDVEAHLTAAAVESIVLGMGARIAELGRLTIGDRSWELGPGGAVEVDPSQATIVLSRGLTLEDTRAALSGDPTLVRAVAGQTCRDM